MELRIIILIFKAYNKLSRSDFGNTTNTSVVDSEPSKLPLKGSSSIVKEMLTSSAISRVPGWSSIWDSGDGEKFKLLDHMK